VSSAFGDGAGGVEIAVRFLGGGDFGDQLIKIAIQFGIGVEAEGIGCTFDDFEDVGVVEEDAFVIAVLLTGGFGEVGNAAGLLALLEVVRDGHGPIGFQARRPEIVLQADGGEGDRGELVADFVGHKSPVAAQSRELRGQRGWLGVRVVR
jgi:hypothetical protein